MKNVIIAEKPSVAQSIAAIVGAEQRKDGYLEGQRLCRNMGFRASGRAGHARSLRVCRFPAGEPAHTASPTRSSPARSVRGKEYKDDPGVVRQLNIIKGLFEGGDRIIVATDAGREGS